MNSHLTLDVSRDNGCFEYLKGNISFSVLCGCETWSLTLKEKHRMKSVWEWAGSKRDDGAGDWIKLRKMKSFLICTPHQALFG